MLWPQDFHFHLPIKILPLLKSIFYHQVINSAKLGAFFVKRNGAENISKLSISHLTEKLSLAVDDFFDIF